MIYRVLAAVGVQKGYLAFFSFTMKKLLILFTLFILPAQLYAGTLGPQSSRLNTSQYALDLFSGPVVSSSRVSALAGAYAGLAEGVEGSSVNPAAPVQRAPWSHSWFDYDLSLGIFLPGSFGGNDFDNNGSVDFEYNDFLFLNGGVNLQFGKTGIGVFIDSRIYELGLNDDKRLEDGSQYVNVSLNSMHYQIAHAFWDGQLMLGLGFRGVTFKIGARLTEAELVQKTPLFSMAGYSIQIGGLWAPWNLPVRLGGCWRQKTESKVEAISGESSDGNNVFAGIFLPQKVVVPWEAEIGIAWELGSRKLNPQWIDPWKYMQSLSSEVEAARANRKQKGIPENQEKLIRKKEEEEIQSIEDDLLNRRRLEYGRFRKDRYLVSASLLIAGTVKDGVGIESFFRKTVDRSGEKISYTPRIGVELEPFPNVIQLRAGSYWEPSRYSYWRSRIHATAGFDLRVFSFDLLGLYEKGTSWAVGGMVDLARRYSSLGFRFGIWR